MPQILKGSLSSELDKIWAQIRRGAFDIYSILQELIVLKSFFQFLFRSFVATFTSVLVWTISYLAFDQTFLVSILFGLLGGGFIFFVLKWFFSYRFLRNSGLTRKEYNYIKKNLKEAKLKINRLQKAMWRTRNLARIGSYRQ
jgi:5-bromo-4-chloroindolyl phosphate hydrolysis protein